MLRLFILIIPLFFFSSYVSSQDYNKRVDDLITGFDLDNRLNKSNLKQIPTFTTDRPKETTLNHKNFNSRQNEIISGDTQTSRAFSSVKDGRSQRPKVNIDGSLLDLSENSIKNAPKTLAGLFGKTGGTCSNHVESSNYTGQKICNNILKRDYQSCSNQRLVSVDREDQWTCKNHSGNLKKVCDSSIKYSCTGSSLPTCLKSNITFSHPVRWEGNTAIISVFNNKTKNACSSKEASVDINFAPNTNITSIKSKLISSGVTLIKSSFIEEYFLAQSLLYDGYNERPSKYFWGINGLFDNQGMVNYNFYRVGSCNSNRYNYDLSMRKAKHLDTFYHPNEKVNVSYLDNYYDRFEAFFLKVYNQTNFISLKNKNLPELFFAQILKNTNSVNSNTQKTVTHIFKNISKDNFVELRLTFEGSCCSSILVSGDMEC